VAWAQNEFIIVTQYLSQRTFRAVIFAADDSRRAVVIDQPLPINLVPVTLRPILWQEWVMTLAVDVFSSEINIYFNFP